MDIRNWWQTAFVKGVYPLGQVNKEWRERTKREILFLIKILHAKKGAKILDVCCGTGRHSIALAQMGYHVTGIDISKVYLAEANKRNKNVNTPVRFLNMDMRKISFKNELDVAINLFTSFGYFPLKSDDAKVLKNIFSALKPGGLFVIETANGSFIKKHFLPKNWSILSNGTIILENSELLKNKDGIRTTWTFLDKNGKKRKMVSFTRLYDKKKMTKVLKMSGFQIIKYFGRLDGSPYNSLKSTRLAIVARKPKT